MIAVQKIGLVYQGIYTSAIHKTGCTTRNHLHFNPVNSILLPQERQSRELVVRGTIRLLKLKIRSTGETADEGSAFTDGPRKSIDVATDSHSVESRIGILRNLDDLNVIDLPVLSAPDTLLRR